MQANTGGRDDILVCRWSWIMLDMAFRSSCEIIFKNKVACIHNKSTPPVEHHQPYTNQLTDPKSGISQPDAADKNAGKIQKNPDLPLAGSAELPLHLLPARCLRMTVGRSQIAVIRGRAFSRLLTA